MMNIEIKVKLKPFSVPNFVIQEGRVGRKEDGFQESPKYALEELDADLLSDLCKRFRADVFAKAGKSDPAEETYRR